MTGKELADRAADEWVEIDQVLARKRGKGWSRRTLHGPCKIVVDRGIRFVTFDWPTDRVDFTLVEGHVVTCQWQGRNVHTTIYDPAGTIVKRKVETICPPLELMRAPS